MASGSDMVDCVVVGAGPAGATAARLLSLRGARVVRDLPESGHGQIMAGFMGRTAPSADGINAVTVFVIDDGAHG